MNLYQKQKKLISRKTERERIAIKRSSRVAKAMSQWENNQNNDIFAESIINKIKIISEKNSVRNIIEMKKRLLSNLDKNIPQPIIFIWGPPYENQGENKSSFSKDQPEFFMMKDIITTLKFLENTGLQIKPILIYADLYGTEINRIPQLEVDSYLEEIKLASPNNFTVTSISKIISQNNVPNFYSTENSSPTIEEIRSAKKTQLKLGRGITYQEALKLALIYRASRLNEGQLLTNGFELDGVEVQDVIKLATAPNKEKDDPYEPALPRFYVKNMTRAAWNKPR